MLEVVRAVGVGRGRRGDRAALGEGAGQGDGRPGDARLAPARQAVVVGIEVDGPGERAGRGQVRRQLAEIVLLGRDAGTEHDAGDPVVAGGPAGRAGGVGAVEVAGRRRLGQRVAGGVAGPEPGESVRAIGAGRGVGRRRGRRGDRVAQLVVPGQPQGHAVEAGIAIIAQAVVVEVAIDIAAETGGPPGPTPPPTRRR